MPGLLNDFAMARKTSKESLFITMCVGQLGAAIDDSRIQLDGLTEMVMGERESVSAELITRLQSVDRFMQRLTNVQVDLERLVRFMALAEVNEQQARWDEFLEQTRATFTMECERNLFDSLFNGVADPVRRTSNEIMLFD